MRPKLSVRDLRFLELARRTALHSTFLRKQVGCLLVKGNKIIARGWNKISHPAVKEFPGISNLLYWSLHSECAALLKAGDVVGATIYLYGIKRGRPGLSRPCPLCYKYLKLRGVSRIVYTGIKGKTIQSEILTP